MVCKIHLHMSSFSPKRNVGILHSTYPLSFAQLIVACHISNNKKLLVTIQSRRTCRACKLCKQHHTTVRSCFSFHSSPFLYNMCNVLAVAGKSSGSGIL